MRTLYEGLFIALVGASAVWGVLYVPDSAPGETWAGIVPFAVACALLLIGALMIIFGYLEQKAATTSHEAVSFTPSHAVLSILGLLAIAFIYHQAIGLFGYLIPTAIVAPVALAAFGVRSWLGLLIAAIVCPLIFHVIFFELLGVYPPYGTVFDLLDLIKG